MANCMVVNRQGNKRERENMEKRKRAILDMKDELLKQGITDWRAEMDPQELEDLGL